MDPEGCIYIFIYIYIYIIHIYINIYVTIKEKGGINLRRRSMGDIGVVGGRKGERRNDVIIF